MTFRVTILPQAKRDIDRNADWWSGHHSVEQALELSDVVYDQIERLLRVCRESFGILTNSALTALPYR